MVAWPFTEVVDDVVIAVHVTNTGAAVPEVAVTSVDVTAGEVLAGVVINGELAVDDESLVDVGVLVDGEFPVDDEFNRVLVRATIDNVLVGSDV